MAKQTEKPIVPRVEIDDATKAETHFFYLPSVQEKIDAGKVTDPKPTAVTIFPGKVNMPQPAKGEKAHQRIELAKMKEHPLQAGIRRYTNRVTDDLILQMIRPAKVNGSEAHENAGNVEHGQDELRHDQPIVSADGFMLRGHRRRLALAYLLAHAPALAARLYPGGTILAEVSPHKADSPQAARIVRDHTQEDERLRPLIIELYDDVQRVTKEHGRESAMAAFNKQALDDMDRLATLPDIIAAMREHAEKEGANLLARNQVNKLYMLALDNAAEKEVTARKEAKRAELEAQGAKPDQIKTELDKIKPLSGVGKSKLREQIDPDPANRGEEYAETFARYTSGKKGSEGRSMQRGNVQKLRKALAHHAATPTQWAAFEGFIGAIADDKYDDALASGQRILDVLPVTTEAAQNAATATATARNAKANKPAKAASAKPASAKKSKK